MYFLSFVPLWITVLFIDIKSLVDGGGDLEKEWFVEYSMRSPYTGEMKRFREYRGINSLKSVDERRSFAETVIDEIKQNISNGWSPFEKPKETYQDNLLLDSVAKRWGTEKEGVVNIRMYLSEFHYRRDFGSAENQWGYA